MQIRNVALAGQVIDYDGVLNPPLCPMDIDGVIEYKDKAYVFIELKYGLKPLSLGQRITYERLVRALNSAGKKSVLVVVSHHAKQSEKVIEAKDLPVRDIYDGRKWTFGEGETLTEFVNEFLGLKK